VRDLVTTALFKQVILFHIVVVENYWYRFFTSYQFFFVFLLSLLHSFCSFFHNAFTAVDGDFSLLKKKVSVVGDVHVLAAICSVVINAVEIIGK